MAAPVNSTITTPTLPVASTPTTSPSSAGLGDVASSLSSAAENTGFSAQISGCFSSMWQSLKSCINWLTCGWLCPTDPVTTPVTVPVAPPVSTLSDQELLAMIRGQFVTAPVTTPVPAADMVTYARDRFNEIQSPVVKMEAYETVLRAVNSTDDIARTFYDALPEGTGIVEASKSAVRRFIWEANGRNDAGHGANYGNHMIATAPRGPTAQQAAQNLRTALAAAATTSTSTTTTSTTTSTTTTSTTTAAIVAADAGRINTIRGVFAAADTAGTAVAVADINNIVAQFTAIQQPTVKLDALAYILNAPRTTDPIAQACIAALPAGTAGTVEVSQEALRQQIWQANSRSSALAGFDHGLNFGPHVIGTAPRGVLVQTAVANLRTLI